MVESVKILDLCINCHFYVPGVYKIAMAKESFATFYVP